MAGLCAVNETPMHEAFRRDNPAHVRRNARAAAAAAIDDDDEFIDDYDDDDD